MPQIELTNKWDSQAEWYTGMVGTSGSKYHQQVAFPEVLRVLNIKHGDRILDLGCGNGVFSKYVNELSGIYCGVDASLNMIKDARNKFANFGAFFPLDICTDFNSDSIKKGSFDAVTFIFSIQDIQNQEIALKHAATYLKPGGKLVVFMKHPFFNVPRHSGWVKDTQTGVVSRKLSRYYSSVAIPLTKKMGDRVSKTYYFHNPLDFYIKQFAKNHLSVVGLTEFADPFLDAEFQKIPMFLCLAGALN